MRSKSEAKKIKAGSTLGSTNYEYNVHNQLVKSGNSNLNYDAQGNLVTDSKREYIWDRDGRLTEIRARETGTSIASYKYDHKGRRVQATLRGA